MKNLQTSFAIFLAIVALSFTVAAQKTSPSPQPTATPVKEAAAVQAPKMLSLSGLKPGERYVSELGRFSIAAPNDKAYELFEKEESFNEEAGDTAGETVSWRVKEGALVVSFTENPVLKFTSDKDYEDLASGVKAGVTETSKFISDKQITQGKYRGYEVLFEGEHGKAVSRSIPVGDRLYTLLIIAAPEVPGSFEELIKALDSLTFTDAPAKK